MRPLKRRRIANIGALAQLVEQWTENPCVRSSNLRGTTRSLRIAIFEGFFVSTNGLSPYIQAMKQMILILATALSLFSCQATKLTPTNIANDTAAIAAVMDMQEQAWSDGDVDQFMEGYWQSEKLSFVGSRGPSYGWKTTLENYRKGYPDKAAMGKLSFEVLRLTPISPDAYYMIGKYTLVREADEPSGYFTLVWRKIDGQWLITDDHTSG